MAYRLNAHFKDCPPNSTPADIIAAETPKYGEMLVVSNHGRDVTVRVTAIWTPWSETKHWIGDGLVVVEAKEI
jgi:hypothetical protein